MLSVVPALPRNPLSELGVGRILLWHDAVAELYLIFTDLPEVVAPLRATQSSINIETRRVLVLVLALAISRLTRPLFSFLFVTLAHGEC